MDDRPGLIVIGGFPGAGKSSVAERLAKELRAARLSSDVLGGSIRRTLDGVIPSSQAFHAGYDLLFRLCEDFLADGCTVVVDCNMGWEFQWQALDQIRAKRPAVIWCPVILRCPMEVCRERLRLRHVADPSGHPPVEEFFARNPQLTGLWAYLEALDRRDVAYVDGSCAPAVVYAEVLGHIRGRFGRFGVGSGRHTEQPPPVHEEPARRANLAAAWEQYADLWTAWARKPNHDSYWRFGRDAFLALLPPAGQLTLDVGCGEGRLSRDLRELGHRVVSIDRSPSLVREAAAAARGLPALVGDAVALPFPDGACDLVVAYMSLHDIDGMEDAVGEAARVLRPGGHLCLAIVHPVNSAGAFTSRASDASFVIEGSYLDPHGYVDRVERDGLPMVFTSRHRPLEHYLMALEAAGLLVEKLREVPGDDSRWRRVPLFLDLRAVKVDPRSP